MLLLSRVLVYLWLLLCCGRLRVVMVYDRDIAVVFCSSKIHRCYHVLPIKLITPVVLIPFVSGCNSRLDFTTSSLWMLYESYYTNLPFLCAGGAEYTENPSAVESTTVVNMLHG